jgi:hypothetical protein
MTDEIPDVLTVDEASIAVSVPGWAVTLTDTNADGSGGLLTATFPGPFNPGDAVAITLTVTVGELPQPDPTVPPDDIFNEARVSSHEPDTKPDDNVDDELTPIKAVTLAASAICINDTPYLDYSVGAVGLVPTLVTLNWWNPEVWNGGNPTGPPTATQTIPLDQLTGTILWFGAAVDANGEPTDWPGWTLLPDGTWVEDPNAPGADLRPSAIVQIEVNPDIAAVQVYPPPTPNCNANPPPNQPPGTPGVPGTPGNPAVPGSPGAPGVPLVPGSLAGPLPRTGAEPMGGLAAGLGLIAAGSAARRLSRRLQARRVRQAMVV